LADQRREENTKKHGKQTTKPRGKGRSYIVTGGKKNLACISIQKKKKKKGRPSFPHAAENWSRGPPGCSRGGNRVVHSGRKEKEKKVREAGHLGKRKGGGISNCAPRRKKPVSAPRGGEEKRGETAYSMERRKKNCLRRSPRPWSEERAHLSPDTGGGEKKARSSSVGGKEKGGKAVRPPSLLRQPVGGRETR